MCPATNFVRNMIAGVRSIDLALFVVAADDGWMPQTEEHFQIPNASAFSGHHRANQMRFRERRRCHCANSRGVARNSVRQLPNCSTSVRTGEGITDLKNALARELRQSRPPRDIAKPRLFVDRAFTLRGVGTVVTGTLNDGSIRRGDEVFVQPRNIPVRVRSIQNHGRDVEIAEAGMRTAMNVPDLSIGESGIQRGDLITLQSLGSARSEMDVLVHRSARLKRNSGAARTIRNGSSVQVHFGTSRIAAKIVFLTFQRLQPGKKRNRSTAASTRRFLHSWTIALLSGILPAEHLAGGRVLDPDGDRATSAAPHRFSS
jgi:selenocysteine-specific elongation factor